MKPERTPYSLFSREKKLKDSTNLCQNVLQSSANQNSTTLAQKADIETKGITHTVQKTKPWSNMFIGE